MWLIECNEDQLHHPPSCRRLLSPNHQQNAAITISMQFSALQSQCITIHYNLNSLQCITISMRFSALQPQCITIHYNLNALQCITISMQLNALQSQYTMQHYDKVQSQCNSLHYNVI